jgi:hypothetical protein
MTYTILTFASAILLEVLLRSWFSSNQWRARIVESLFAFGIGSMALYSIFEHHLSGLSLENGINESGLLTLYAALGFFIYHLHRVLFVPGFTKSLILHHLGMILCIAGALISTKAYFYILIASIPILSAAVRNIRWFWKMSGRPRWYRGAVTAASVYVLFESLPPLFAVVHFFWIGIHQMNLPVAMWAFVVVPGLILALLTSYWSVLFVHKTVFRTEP